MRAEFHVNLDLFLDFGVVADVPPNFYDAYSPWVPEGSLAGFFWVGFWGLGGPWGL